MKPILVKLPTRFMLISGPDADKFLQGQCSLDINQLSSHEFKFGTLNDPKGRMYCLFKLCRYQDGLLLGLHETLFHNTIETLSKYKVFFKCDINEIELDAYGALNWEHKSTCSTAAQHLYSEAVKSNFSQQNGSLCLKLPGTQNLIEFWTPPELTNQFFYPDASNTKDDSSGIEISQTTSLWLHELYLAGIPDLSQDTVGKFILQELNLQELDAVSFKKGCYTGQEIIARMKYLGKLKKRMFLLSSSKSAKLSPLVKVVDQEGAKLGVIVCASNTDKQGTASLAVLNTESAKSLEQLQKTVRIEMSDSPEFSIKSLSYEN